MNFLFERFQIALQSESWPERGRRMRLAAWYGVLAATAFVWANALVNVFSFPRLPLALDWSYTLVIWAWLSLALGLAGLIAGWFTEEYQGVVGGGIILTVLLALVFLLQMQDAPTMQSVLMALPLLGVGMAAAGALRWTARRHIHVTLQQSGWLRRKQLAQHLLLIVCIGLFAGILGRLDWPAEQALTNLDTYLSRCAKQSAGTDVFAHPTSAFFGGTLRC